MALYTLLKQEGHARRAVYQTPHGTIQMPAFMNVATDGAISTVRNPSQWLAVL